MNFFEKEFTFDRFIRFLISIALIIGIVMALDYLSSVLIPFVIAVIIAYFMSPLINFIQKYIHKRFLSVLVGLLLVIGVFTGVGFIIVPMIGNEINHAGILFDNLFSTTDWQHQLDIYLPDAVSDKIKNFIESGDLKLLVNDNQLDELVDFGVKKLLPGIGSIVGYTYEVVIGTLGLLIILLYLFFILLDFSSLVSSWKGLIPPKFKNKVLSFVSDFEVAMNNYFRAQALIASIVGVLFAIGFTIIGLPLGIVLGIFIGFLNMIPYLQNLALVPALFLAVLKSLETGQNLWVILGLVALIFVIVQIIQDGFLTPKIMGNATGLNPAVILLSLSIWGKLLGMLGLLIALPMTYLILSYYQRMISKSQKKEGPEARKSDIDIITNNLRKLP